MLNPTTAGGETMTHLVSPDTFNLSQVSRSASVIPESLMKLGASRWGVSLPWILLWARSSFWRSGAFLKFISSGSPSWVCTIQAAIVFTASWWPWFLLIWFRPPYHWISQVQGEGDRQTECQVRKLREGTERSDRNILSFLKTHEINKSCGYLHRMEPGALTIVDDCVLLSYISRHSYYTFNLSIRQNAFFFRGW